ncbi:UNVERIFIED_CONTAM: hypothetical protein NCL1_29302 [Trichonephila clavipes]
MSKLNGRAGLACVIYEEGVEYDSLRQDGTLNFLICTDSLSSLHCLLNVNSTEKLVVEVQSILYYLDYEIHFSHVQVHSGNLGNDTANQLAKEATCQNMKPFDVCTIVPLETFSLGKNCFFQEHQVLGLT